MRKRTKPIKRKVPRLRTDAEAERFLERGLSGLDFSQFRPARFEFQPKTARVNMRPSKPLSGSVKRKRRTRRMIRVSELAKQWMKDPKYRAEYDALEEEFARIAASSVERTRLSEPHPLIHHQSMRKRKKTAR